MPQNMTKDQLRKCELLKQKLLSRGKDAVEDFLGGPYDPNENREKLDKRFEKRFQEVCQRCLDLYFNGYDIK